MKNDPHEWNIVPVPIYKDDSVFDIKLNPVKGVKHPFECDLYSGVKDVIDFENKKVLDYGGSFGNLIISSNGKIKEENYTCLDVDNVALEMGRKRFPHSTWLYHNRYNPMYNFQGNDTFSHQLETYDIIFAYSVFTHTSYEEFIWTIEKLKQYLNPNGSIFVTVCLQQDTRLLEWYRSRRIDEFGNQDNYELNDSYICITDNIQSEIIPNNCNRLLTFYDEEFIMKIGKVHKAKIAQTLIEIGKQ